MGDYMKNKILEIIFFITTILMGLISTGKIEIDEVWKITIFIIQVITWLGYINLINMEKRYKIELSVLSLSAFFIIGLFYFIK